jgi:hypothetical protein
MYRTIRSLSRRLRTQWSYDSSCQKGCLASPSNWLACRAVQDFNQRVMPGTGTLGSITAFSAANRLRHQAGNACSSHGGRGRDQPP